MSQCPLKTLGCTFVGTHKERHIPTLPTYHARICAWDSSGEISKHPHGELKTSNFSSARVLANSPQIA